MSAQVFWAGLISSMMTVLFVWWYVRSVRETHGQQLFHALMLILGCVAAAGVVMLGTVGILHLTFGPLIR